MGKRKSFLRRMHESDREMDREYIINLIENEIRDAQDEDREVTYDSLKHYDHHMWNEEEWTRYFDKQKREKMRELKEEQKEEISEKAKIAAEDEYFEECKQYHKEVLEEYGNPDIENAAEARAYQEEMNQSYFNGMATTVIMGIALAALIILL